MAAIRTAFKLLDEQLQRAKPQLNYASSHRFHRNNGDERIFKHPAVAKAQAEFDKVAKAHAKASNKLRLAITRVAERVNKRAQADYDKKYKEWAKLVDEVEHIKITLSLGEDAADKVLALLDKLKAL